MTALEKAFLRLQKVSNKLLDVLADVWIGEAQEPDYFEFNGVRGIEEEDASITCSCGRNYKLIKNWKKHVIEMHGGSI